MVATHCAVLSRTAAVPEVNTFVSDVTSVLCRGLSHVRVSLVIAAVTMAR